MGVWGLERSAGSRGPGWATGPNLWVGSCSAGPRAQPLGTGSRSGVTATRGSAVRGGEVRCGTGCSGAVRGVAVRGGAVLGGAG